VFPEFTQLFADPTRPTAPALLKLYPNAQALVTAGVERLTHKLQELSPTHYGRATAEQLVSLAHQSVSSGLANAARSTSLRILCDQLEHPLVNVANLEQEMDQLIIKDPQTKGLRSVPEFGPKTVAVLRAELGDVDRFSCITQVVASAGLDIEVQESGKWRGQAKLCKRGSGRIRWVLYLAALRSTRLEESALGAYSHRLVARGMKKGKALMAVMRKCRLFALHRWRLHLVSWRCFNRGWLH